MTLEELRQHKKDIDALAAKHGAFNVRVFGSVVRGEAGPNSDVDFLVNFREGSSIFNEVALWLDLRDLLGCEIDLLTDHASAGKVTAHARTEAVAL